MSLLEDDPWLIGIGEKLLSYGCFLSGDSAAVTFTELFNTNEDALDQYVMMSYPANDTVYRLVPTTTAGIDQFNKTQFRMSPTSVT